MPVRKRITVQGRRFRLVAERTNSPAAQGLARKIRTSGAKAVVRRVPSKSRPGKTSFAVFARSGE